MTGRVTLDGEPLPGGTVTFHPLSGGPRAYGSIAPKGSYRLKTGLRPGLRPGAYAVAVVTYEPVASAAPGHPGRRLTPDRYATAEESGLVADVHPGSNVIDIELTKGE